MEKWKFGINNNKLVNLVLDGKKTATSSLNSNSYIGEISQILFDSNDIACTIEITNIIKIKFKDVSWDLAKLEGENNSLLEWKEEHYNFFKNIDKNFNENSIITIEVFKVINKTQVFYHVVTERPMNIGDTIIFDNNHHSGLYERVYSLKYKVDDIYNNFNKYENVELEHHVMVALRELALEEVRLNNYPKYPSRLSSVYVSNTLEEAKKWYDLFKEWNRKVYGIVKVITDGNIYIGDSWNCFDATINKEDNLKKAHDYWNSKTNKLGKEPIVEIIIDGNIKVIDKVYE